MTHKHLELLVKAKEVRDTQRAYFASRKGRYGDRKILARSKQLEGELDKMIDEQMAFAGELEIFEE